jgi:hypothetical protein
MKRAATIFLAMFALAAVAGTASAALRSPQVPLAGDCLQSLLNSQGESINAATQQQDIQRWQATVSNNSTFTLQVELTGNAAGNTYGIYNAGFAVPPLYLVFPGAATTGWFATASFRTAPTRLVVNLFDNNAAFVGTVTYLAGPPDRNDFGFYLQGPGTGGAPVFTQDARNPGGAAFALTYAGTGINSGSWWLAWEDQIGENDFCDALFFLESINPTPVSKTTWGSLMARFK